MRKTPATAEISRAGWWTILGARTLRGLFFWLATTIAVRGQCAICKTAIANSAQGASLAQGLNLGILFLLAIPFLLVLTISLLIWRSHQELRSAPAPDREHNQGTGDVLS